MTPAKCPGQDPMFMTSKDVAEVECPHCGHVVEFWPDELVRTCRGCRGRVTNPTNSLKCLEWCASAAECLAALRGPGDAEMAPLREELAERVKGAFGDDEPRLARTTAVLEAAEAIGREEGAEPLVLLPAALLHDVGRGAEGRREAAAGLLEGLPLPGIVRQRILDIVEHQDDAEPVERLEARVLADARLIVSLREQGRRDAGDVLAREARTEAGKHFGLEAPEGKV
jgi:hypothetical protein